MKKIVTIGEIVVEIMATERGDGFLEPLRLEGPFPSGAPAIFIDQVGRLGQPCGMVGRVGNDDFGRLNIRRLERDGVDVSAIAIDPEAATGKRLRALSPIGRPRLRLQHQAQRQRRDPPRRRGRNSDRRRGPSPRHGLVALLARHRGGDRGGGGTCEEPGAARSRSTRTSAARCWTCRGCATRC